MRVVANNRHGPCRFSVAHRALLYIVADMGSDTKQTQIRLPRSLHRRLRLQADREGCSLNSHMLRLLAEGSDRLQREDETMSSTYSIDTDALTVIRTDEHGEQYDLNAEGEPCEDVAELRDFISTLHQQGAFDRATACRLQNDCNHIAADGEVV